MKNIKEDKENNLKGCTVTLYEPECEINCSFLMLVHQVLATKEGSRSANSSLLKEEVSGWNRAKSTVSTVIGPRPSKLIHLMPL